MNIDIFSLIGIIAVALGAGVLIPGLKKILDYFNEYEVTAEDDIDETLKKTNVKMNKTDREVEEAEEKASKEREEIEEEISNESSQNIVNRFYDVFSKRPSHKSGGGTKTSR